MIKVASQNDLPSVENIMRRIHDEEPSYWPYGLDANQFNGGLYMIQKEANDKPVGFVGWQKFDEGPRKVGYYAIGILPEHREKTFAKQAVTQVMRHMGEHCDEVRAMVMAHNEPSKALAKSVDVTMIEKLAMDKEALGTGAKAALGVLTGLATGGAVDAVTYKDDGVVGRIRGKNDGADSAAVGDFLLNAIVGGGAPFVPNTAAAIALPVAAQATTIGFGSIRNARRANAIAEAQVRATEKAGEIPTAALVGAGGLGLGALAILAYKAKKKADAEEKALEQQSRGRVRITLPTKNPGDNETEVELPIEDMNFSKALHGRLRRDTTRRLNAETMGRTRSRGRSKAPVEELSVMGKAAGLQELVNEIGFYKEAIGPAPAPQNAVPSPPQLGQNPALRMGQQEQAVAQSIQPATDANPAIQEAEAAAMQAEQAGAEQAAQIEQAAQQAQMDQQAQFQQAMMKSEQEKEVLKLQLEKEKAMKELNDAQAKSVAEAGKGEGTEAQKLITNRLSRLGKRVKSAKANVQPAPQVPGGATPNPIPDGTPGTINPQTGRTIPEDPIHLRPETGQNINNYAGSTQWIPRIGAYRTSYGPIGDTLYDLFLRQNAVTPDAPNFKPVSMTDLANTPDKMGAISRYFRNMQQAPPWMAGAGFR